MALDTRLKLSVSAKLTSALDLLTATADLAKDYALTLASGTGSGQADLAWCDQRTLLASANEDLDLAGTLAGLLGGTATFARVKGLIVAAAATNTNDVVVGGAATNTWIGPFGAATHTTKVRPGGWVGWGCTDVTGWPVTAATGDLLRIANGGAGTQVVYDIIVIGASA